MHVLSANFIDKCKLSFLGIVLTCFLFIFQSNTSSAQAPGLLEFAGRAVKDGKPLSGATVTVFRNGTILQEQIKTGRNGKFDFSLAFGVDYKMTFTYPGCVDMYLMVYTGKLPPSRNDL